MQRIISVTDTMDLTPLSSYCFSSENMTIISNYSLTLKTSELNQINSHKRKKYKNCKQYIAVDDPLI